MEADVDAGTRALRGRLERERAARRAAEEIAERTTRELFDRQRELALMVSVAAAANRSRSPEEALDHVLENLCGHLRWPVAQAWILDEATGELRRSRARHVTDEVACRAFVEGSERWRFVAGEGLPGRVLAGGGPVWLTDVTDDANFPRAPLARAAGLRAAIGLPVIVGGGVIAVLECFATEVIERREEVLELGALVGELLAQVFERELHERTLRREAFFDALTGLPNRGRFRECVTRALERAGDAGPGFAVVMIDLDRFKEVNDTLGHDQGDHLLVEVGDRLRRALGPEDLIARLGGDEFAMVLGDTGDVAAAEAVAARLTDTLRDPVFLGGVPVGVDASFGIALHPAHGSELSALVRHADIALSQAKRAHNGWAVYAPSTARPTSERLALASDLRAAIEGEALDVHYQPKVSVSGRALAGVEALVRWSHPERGLIPPVQFIPLAENTRLMAPLTSHVLSRALTQVRAWLAQGVEVAVAVNVAPRSLLEPEFPVQVAAALARTGVPPSLLELEVTESSVLEDPRRARQTLDELGAIGVSIAIDDFGTGFSSLSQLKQLPVATLKIDRSFVASMLTDARDMFIVRAAIRLGHDLGMEVVAEGVEDEATFSLLAELGCDLAQGYLIHRPVEAVALGEWLVAAAERRTAVGQPVVADGRPVRLSA